MPLHLHLNCLLVLSINSLSKSLSLSWFRVLYRIREPELNSRSTRALDDKVVLYLKNSCLTFWWRFSIDKSLSLSFKNSRCSLDCSAVWSLKSNYNLSTVARPLSSCPSAVRDPHSWWTWRQWTVGCLISCWGWRSDGCFHLRCAASPCIVSFG